MNRDDELLIYTLLAEPWSTTARNAEHARRIRGDDVFDLLLHLFLRFNRRRAKRLSIGLLDKPLNSSLYLDISTVELSIDMIEELADPIGLLPAIGLKPPGR